MITESREPSAAVINHPAHAHCILCGQNNPRGFNLSFRRNGEEGVEGCFDCHSHWEGYPGMMHGGVISMLIDGAMTNCMFVHGRTGVTARMELAFRHPVRTNGEVTVRAWMERVNHPVYRLQAHLVQSGQIKVTAQAIFKDQSGLSETEPA